MLRHEEAVASSLGGSCLLVPHRQTPLGKLTVLPQTPQWHLRGPTSKGREGREVGRGIGKGGRKIIKIVANICRILRPKCTKFDFDWDSAPDPTGGAHSAPLTP